MQKNYFKPIKNIFYPEKPSGYKVFMEYVRVIAVAGLLAFSFRTFITSPYKIPSSSMMPTLLVGDFLFVSKFTYGLPIPFSGGKRLFASPPEKGDIIVFEKKLPLGGYQNTIKRVVALPGDKISFNNQTLSVNGVEATFKGGSTYAYHYDGKDIKANLREEHLSGVYYQTLIRTPYGQNVPEMQVPQGHVVVVGDNRDSSYDSRFWHYPSWGFVPLEDIVGRAEFIFWSWEKSLKPRLERIGTSLHPQKSLIPNPQLDPQ